jgi:hypothetical protein
LREQQEQRPGSSRPPMCWPLAARLGHGFCEATEIYSVFEGRTT